MRRDRNRHSLFAGLVSIGLLITSGFTVPGALHAAERPNILLIVAEDMGARVGAFGDPVAKTPAIDALAESGVRYTRAFTAAGVCAPSRAALITGRYPTSIGAQHMRTANRGYEAVPPAEVKAFPELLRREGYATANVAKTDYQFGEPFTIWDINTRDIQGTPDLAVWRNLPDDKPFFAMINLQSTHESWLATAETKGYGPFTDFIKFIVDNRAKNVRSVTRPEDVAVPPYFPDVPAVRESLAQHYDNIHFMDGQVREIIANLDADGLTANTVIIWTADNGDGVPRAKRSVYDSGIHVPLIVVQPGTGERGQTDARLISFIDFAPTLLRLAGAEVPSWTQGRDFLDETARHRTYIHAVQDRMDDVPGRFRAVRDDRYKYIRNYHPEKPWFQPLAFRDMFPIMQHLWAGHTAGTLNQIQEAGFVAPRAREELYDTVADPNEIRNIAADSSMQPVLERLRNEMDAWLAAAGDWSDESEEAMKERMWPGATQPETAPPVAAFEQGADGARSLKLSSLTDGASIGWRAVAPDNSAQWQVYVAPIAVQPGHHIETKAIRYGYVESPVTSVRVE